MISRDFRINIFVRVIIVAVLAIALAFVLLEQQLLFAPLSLLLALAFAVINLIRYIEKSTRDLTHFLFSIRQGAFTESYASGSRGKPHKELSDALNNVIREFASLNLEKELQYQYLQALNENINVAILSFDATGKLMMMNPAARQLLNTPAVSKLDDLQSIDPSLYDAATGIRADAKEVRRIFIAGEPLQLGIQAKDIMLLEKPVRIILLQNLSNELDEKETEAWHQLMRVLTHEIMNSVTPILSLTDAVRSILNNPDGTRKDLRHLTSENIEDVFTCLQTLSSRGKGLLNFVNAYREYSKPPDVRMETADVVALVRRVVLLLNPDLQKFQIQLNVHTQGVSLTARTDAPLMEQVLINLVKNAIEAVDHDGSGEIDINIRQKNGKLVSLSVADNGSGMEPEVLSRIFIPFYTTKKKGTGIGLSLCRQIMKFHNGIIRANSSPGEGSVFTLEWS